MSIHFRTRKYGSDIGFSFPLKSGPEYADLAQYREGDEVVIIEDITEEMFEACRDIKQLDGSVHSVMDRSTAHLRFQVIKRSHCWGIRDERATNHLFEVSHSLTLEAVNGYVEDLLLWITNGEIPRWAQ